MGTISKNHLVSSHFFNFVGTKSNIFCYISQIIFSLCTPHVWISIVKRHSIPINRRNEVPSLLYYFNIFYPNSLDMVYAFLVHAGMIQFYKISICSHEFFKRTLSNDSSISKNNNFVKSSNRF